MNKTQVNLGNPFGGFRVTFVLAIAAILLVVITFLITVRIQKVTGTEVGVKLNNLTGEIEIISNSGTHIYNAFLHSFHLLDMTVQRLEMTADPSRGDRLGADDLRIKTVDGSDVYVDLTINYKLRPDMIKEVVQTSGLADAYKVKWVRDYSRSVCRNIFGEMTTEEFYDANVRNEKSAKAKEELNELLSPYGIELIQVVAEKFRFHPEYEEKIRAKKLADQEVEEQVSKANAARQNQVFKTVEANKKKDVLIASISGQMRQLIVEAEAEAEKNVKDSESYAIETRLGAEANYYRNEKNAQAIEAKTKAEAEALEQMAEALKGEGGRNIVKLEYANRLKNVEFSGQPFSINNELERFSHSQEAATSSNKTSNK